MNLWHFQAFDGDAFAIQVQIEQILLFASFSLHPAPLSPLLLLHSLLVPLLGMFVATSTAVNSAFAFSATRLVLVMNLSVSVVRVRLSSSHLSCRSALREKGTMPTRSQAFLTRSGAKALAQGCFRSSSISNLPIRGIVLADEWEVVEVSTFWFSLMSMA